MTKRNTYLMWVGAEHYDNIAKYATEAINLGISKRMPNLAMAQALMKPGVVVYLAHDEHSYHDCPECIGEIQCPTCRKREQSIIRLQKELDTLEDELDMLKDEHMDLLNAAKASEPSERLAEIHEAVEKNASCQIKVVKLQKNRQAKIEKLEQEKKDCAECDGRGKYDAGTGGVVAVDGKKWDYRQYNYWLHQPKIWRADEHKVDAMMCENCGGTGRLPDAKLFGLFIPVGIEYIMTEGEEGCEERIKELKEAGISAISSLELKSEMKRGCGIRKPGGYYIVTKPGSESASGIRDEIEKLSKSKMLNEEGVEVNGNFVKFNAPVEIDGVKRFRGVKLWSPTEEAEDEAEMIMEAIAV